MTAEPKVCAAEDGSGARVAFQTGEDAEVVLGVEVAIVLDGESEDARRSITVRLDEVREEKNCLEFSARSGEKVRLEPAGGIVATTAPGEPARRIRRVEINFCEIHDGQDGGGQEVRRPRRLPVQRVLTQGYQTWNLSSAYQTSDSRQKSVASRLGLSGMFQDTDNQTWTQQGKGIESHGFVVLEGSGDAPDSSLLLLLGGTSCRQGVTSFWVHQHWRRDGRPAVAIKCFVDFGVPGVAGTAAENFWMGSADTAQRLVEAYAERVQSAQDNDAASDSELELDSPLRKLGRAPVGWGSWYEYYEKVTSADVDTVLAAITADDAVKRSIDVFQLDDGFQLNTGDWLVTQPAFGEDRLDHVAERIRSAGFTPGLWIAPFLVSKTSLVFRRHPDWVLRSLKTGKPIVGHINPAWKRRDSRGGCRSSMASMVMYVLDLSMPEVLDHLSSLFRELSQHWSFFKIDFLAAGMREGRRRHAADQTRVESYIAGLKAVRRGIGSQSYLLGCGAPILPSAQAGVLDAMRVSCDTAERWLPGRERYVVSDWAIPCCRNALWGSMTRYYMHGVLWKHSDPDCLVLRRAGSGISEEEVRTQVTILGLTGGLLLFTDNMSTLENDRKDLALGVLPATPLRGVPFGDMMAPNLPPRGFAVNDPEDEAAHVAAAVVNWTKRPLSAPVTRDCFDFWHQRRYRAGERVRLGANSVSACQMAARGAVLVGTTIHLTALADGRIAQEQIGDSQWLISGTDIFAKRSGLLVFQGSADDVTVLEHAGLALKGGLFAVPDALHETCAVEVEITAPRWSLELSTISQSESASAA